LDATGWAQKRFAFLAGLFDMALKNLGFLGFFKKPKNLKSPNLGFLGFKKKYKPNVRFKLLSSSIYHFQIEQFSTL